jgi:phenylacetic acid degradation operon negative regulatory protein
MQASLPPLSAKALLLDMLRMVHPLALPVSLLVHTAELLGLSENALRVNITRLLAREQIEQDERGYYRLGKQVEPVGQWLQQWQRGERRVKKWRGDWLLLHSTNELKSKEQNELFKMASYFGFRELMPGICIRPNNLSQTLDELAKKISGFSHVDAFMITQSDDFVSPAVKTFNLNSLWNREQLEQQYQEIIETLKKGIQQASSLSVEKSFRDSYFVGAEVHHRFALDPLLPAEMINVDLRKQVVELFTAYDACYRPAWIKFFKGYVLSSPSIPFEEALLV